MIDVYTANTPNGVKITIALEEMGQRAGEDYNLHVLNLGEGDQKKPDFLKINPNGRIPAIVDHVDGRDIRVFESGAILLYLAEKIGQLLPSDPAARIDAIAWTYFQTGGIGPMMGQAGFFKNNFPDFEPGFERFFKESERLVSVLEDSLQDRNYLVGDDITIADIMNFGWIDRAPGYVGLDLSKFPGVSKWRDRMAARDGVTRGLSVLQS